MTNPYNDPMVRRERMAHCHRSCADANVYVLVVFDGVCGTPGRGAAFALNRNYALSSRETMILQEVTEELLPRCIKVETQRGWWNDVAPAWAWCEKAHGTKFTAYWFDPVLKVSDAWTRGEEVTA